MPENKEIQVQDAVASEWDDWSDDAVKSQVEHDELQRAIASKFFKIPEGSTKIRVLPALKGGKPIREVKEHYVKVAGQRNGQRIVCSFAEIGDACLVCALQAKLRSTGNPADTARADEMDAKSRWYINATIRSLPEGSPSKIIGVSWQIYQRLMHFRKALGIDYTHPASGVDIIISREGTDANSTKYTVDLDPNGKTPLANSAEMMSKILATRANLDEQAALLDDNEVRTKLSPPGGAKGLPQGRRAQNMLP